MPSGSVHESIYISCCRQIIIKPAKNVASTRHVSPTIFFLFSSTAAGSSAGIIKQARYFNENQKQKKFVTTLATLGGKKILCCSMLQCIVACWLRVETGLICTQHIPPNQSATDCSALQHTETHCNTLQHTATHCNTLQRRDRGVYSIWGGRSLYCLHFDISQLMEPEACFGIFV